MPKLLTSCHSSNEHYSADCDWMIVHMTPAYAGKILALMDYVKQISRHIDGLFDLRVRDSHFQCYSFDTLTHFDGQASANFLDDHNGSLIPLPYTDEEIDTLEAEQVEVCLLEVAPDEVQWTCAPKGDETIIFTRLFTRADIEPWRTAKE